MTKTIKAACVQMTSKPDIEANLKQAEGFIRQAASEGAQFISTPENTDMLGTSLRETIERAKVEDEHAGIPFFSDLARELGITLVIGSMKVKLERKIANRCFVFGPDGKELARYDKMHMFDVDLPNGERYRESSEYEAGDKAVLVETDFAKIGISICYDLRFPHLYRDLAKKGAEILTVPSAFTVPTGEAHWHVLQRARAIETGCFVVSAAQVGEHGAGRKTYGHSIIVSPWGEVLAEAGTEPGIIMADLDLAAVKNARQSIPSLQHDREYAF
ncbi:MAG: carbon-nitrogen hydrolase family protein [Pseudomonadota bacterium]